MIKTPIPCPDFRVTSNGTVFRVEKRLMMNIWFFCSYNDWLPMGRNVNGKFKVSTFYTEEGATKAMVECQKEKNFEKEKWFPS